MVRRPGLLLVCVAWALLTGQRALVWQNELTLWTDAVAKAPGRPRTLNNYGRALQLVGRDDEAIAAYQLATAASFNDRRLHGGNVAARLSAQTNLATVLMKRGQVQPALWILQDVLRDTEWPFFPYALFQRGVIEAYADQCDRAQADWRIAYALDGTLRPLPSIVPCQTVQ